MGQNRRRYSREFKLHALKLVAESDRWPTLPAASASRVPRPAYFVGDDFFD